MPHLKQPEPTPGAMEGVIDDTMLDEGAIEGATDDRASDRSDRHCCLQTTTNQKDNVSLSPRYNTCTYMSKVQSDLHQIKLLLDLLQKYVQYV